MPKVVYVANEFPVAVEPYVWEEIRELRNRGVHVVATSMRRPRRVPEELRRAAAETLYLRPMSFVLLMQAVLLCLRHLGTVLNLCLQALLCSRESFVRRCRAVAHTLIGVYYAAQLKGRNIEHIHVHHGYFAAWVAMTAAQVMGISYSMTLHGSDLLLHHAYMDLKLRNCKFCLTVSEYNRQHILGNYPGIPADKIRVQRMGVHTLGAPSHLDPSRHPDPWLVMLSVGRLNPVKDHAFLLRACTRLKSQNFRFICLIAGEGPERSNLEKLIRMFGLEREVTLLGYIPRGKLEAYYKMCDLAVLTSRSEGIPLTLMEAMAHGRTVLAPAITGIPELVDDGVTGFLYRPGSVEDFVAKVEKIGSLLPNLDAVRRRAKRHVLEHFNRATNLASFARIFPELVCANRHENSLLQQI